MFLFGYFCQSKSYQFTNDEKDMGTIVAEAKEANRIKPWSVCLKIGVAFIGAALLATGIVLIILGNNVYGATALTIPAYCLLGIGGLVGTVVFFVGAKGILATYHKYLEERRLEALS